MSHILIIRFRKFTACKKRFEITHSAHQTIPWGHIVALFSQTTNAILCEVSRNALLWQRSAHTNLYMPGVIFKLHIWMLYTFIRPLFLVSNNIPLEPPKTPIYIPIPTPRVHIENKIQIQRVENWARTVYMRRTTWCVASSYTCSIYAANSTPPKIDMHSQVQKKKMCIYRKIVK